MIRELGEAVPIKTKAGLIATSAALVPLTAPFMGFIPNQVHDILNHIGMANKDGMMISTGLALGLAVTTWPFLAAKGIELFIPPTHIRLRKERKIKFGQMEFSESDLFTNILITGAIGSGKTSSVIYPLLGQICSMYNEETKDVKAPHQKWGGLVLDVKGEFYETLIYFLHRSGRNVLEDLILIRPDSDYPIVKLEDQDNGNMFFLCAAGGSEAREIDLLTKGYDLANGELIPSTVFTGTAEAREQHEEHLKSLTFVVKEPLCFVGWREEGGRLVRVEHTAVDRAVHYAKDASGNKIYVPPPKRLKYVGVEHVNNGIQYNICSPHLPPAEIASRLSSIAETLGGGAGGGDNAYWTDSAKKHIGYVIHLWKNLNKEEASALEIVRLTTQKTALDDELRKLEVKLQELHEESLKNREDAVKFKEKETKRRFLTDVQKYFSDEWGKLDPKTKGIIVSVISNLFGAFLTDYKLQEVFCKPATITFEDCIQKGKVITLLAGGDYETLAKQLGTSLKMDFQSLCKQRTSQAHLNKTRVLMFMADEAQVYVTAGGSNNTGDENFMALSRQSRVINAIATQSDSSILSVIGEKKGPVYFQSFGGRIWLQNTDYTTNQNAARMLGKVKKEEVTSSGKEFSIDSAFGKESGASVNTQMKEDERFKIETFSNLNIFDAIIYNKGKKGVRDKASKYKGVPDPVGWPGTPDFKARYKTLRWFYQAYIENRLYKTQEVYRLDAKPGGSYTPVTPDETARKAVEEEELKKKEAQDLANSSEDMKLDAVTSGSVPLNRKDVTDDVPTKGGAPALVPTHNVLVSGYDNDPKEQHAPEDSSAANELLGNDLGEDEEGVSPERIEELQKIYGSSSQISSQLMEFASFIDDAELPMRAEFDPESFLLEEPNEDDADKLPKPVDGGIFTPGAYDDPFPVEVPDDGSFPVPLAPTNVVTGSGSIPPPSAPVDEGKRFFDGLH